MTQADTRDAFAPRAVGQRLAPERLHHYNFMAKDAEATRAFYEGLLGIPLVVFWVEVMPAPSGGGTVALGHAFYGLGDGSLLAFITCPDPKIHAAMAPLPQPDTAHIALKVTDKVQAEALKRLRAAGHKVMEIDHGFITSIYFKDPDGLTIEYSVDPHNHEEIYGEQKAGLADENFQRFTSGDHTQTQKWFPKELPDMKYK